MFLGIVVRPIPHCYFDGYILLERLSTQVNVTKLTVNANFSDDVNVNCATKSSE